MPQNKSAPVVIAGAGAWGLSTALHLVNDGYTNITVFDRATEIPSRYSGGYDLNKIVRAEYEDPFYTDLALEAIKQWRTPLFGPYYHHAGYVVAATDKAPEKAIHHLQAALGSVREHPAFKPFISPLNKPQDFKDIFWQFTGPASFKGYINRYAGYAHSANAMKGIYRHLTTRGVRFVLGDAGRISELQYSDSPRRCKGVRTADGRVHNADLVIVCLGAYAAGLIPQVGNFAVAKCWSVAHVQLTEEECDYLRGIPVLNIRDLGFFFEPDPATKLFKICPLGGGYINTNEKTGISLPPLDALPPPQDHIPIEDERKLRRLLRETFPWMADRPFVDQKMCWFSDTADSEYCIDFVPNTDKSVVVLSGDSGHGFKMMPIVGSWVLNLLKDHQQKLQRWQWKPETAESGKAWGEAVSWRVGQTKEISEVIEEQKRVQQRVGESHCMGPGLQVVASPWQSLGKDSVLNRAVLPARRALIVGSPAHPILLPHHALTGSGSVADGPPTRWSEKIWVTRGLLEDLERRAESSEFQTQSRRQTDGSNAGPSHDVDESRAASVVGGTDSGRATPSAQLTNPFSHHAPRYVADSTGRPWYLGTSSNWAFNRRVLEIVHERLTGVTAPTDTLSFDGTLYDLGWDGRQDAPSDQQLIPSADYAMFLVNAVKFHCGQMFHLFDEKTFMRGFKEFYDSPSDMNSRGNWYIHFLLILAFGKAFVARRKNPRKAPGSELYVQAIKLMPDIMFLLEEPVQAVEILCCKALYLQCLDFRCAAYNVIGQALRISLEQGMQSNMRGQGLDEAHVQRCLNAWWTVYILDRQMSSLMGVPLALKDSEISAHLPTFAGAPQKSMALELHVKLSRIIAQILNTVYGSEGRLTRKFILSAKSSLKSIAEVTDQLKDTFEELRGQTSGGISRLAAHLDLLHHQCVVVATRPLLFSLLKIRFDEPNGVGPLIKSSTSAKALLRMCIESSQHIVAVLDRLKDQSLLESFLPFDLEAAVAGSMVLLLAPILEPELLPNSTPWLDILHAVLDEMIAQGQIQATKRKAELQRLQQVFEQLPPPLTETPDFPTQALIAAGPMDVPGHVDPMITGAGPEDYGFVEDAIWRTDFTAEHLMAIADTLDLDGFEWMTNASSGFAHE